MSQQNYEHVCAIVRKTDQSDHSMVVEYLSIIHPNIPTPDTGHAWWVHHYGLVVAIVADMDTNYDKDKLVHIYTSLFLYTVRQFENLYLEVYD